MNRMKKAVLGAVIAGTTLTGGALGANLVGTATAADTTTTAAVATTDSSADSSSQTPPAQTDPSKGGHVGQNGVKEELLTGDTATKVKDAALAAVPGGTVQRVENDAEGATYEAHMTKADGSQVTVKLDANFKVTGIETGGPGKK